MPVNSQMRVLTIFLQLLSGKTLTKKELINESGKDAVTIQRDIGYIDEALEKHAEHVYFNTPTAVPLPFEDFVKKNTIQRTGKGHYALNAFGGRTDFPSVSDLTDEELLVILKIILASRTLSNAEMTTLCDKIVNLAHNNLLVKKLISNEKTFYQGVPKTPQFDKIQLICDCILKSNEIQFSYEKNGETLTLTRIPQAIYFSDLYLYMLTASQYVKDDAGLLHLNKFRIANMQDIQIISTNNKINYAERFEGGMLRKQTNLPFLGHPITMIIDFFWDPVYVLDRFPDSKIISVKNGVYRIEMNVNDGYGMKMWLLSQGDMVKVISPRHMLDYIVNDMIGALNYYGYSVTKNEKGADEKSPTPPSDTSSTPDSPAQ